MRALSVFAIGLSIWVTGLSAQPRHEYWYAGDSADETIVDFVDGSSITTDDGGLKRAWIIAFYSPKAKQFPNIHTSAMTQFNCRTRQMRALQVAANDATGQSLPSLSENNPEAWSYVVPGSLGEAELTIICAKPTAERRAAIKLAPQVEMADFAKAIFDSAAARGAASSKSDAQQ